MKLLAFAVYLGTLIFFLVLFALRAALYADWGNTWNSYFGLIYNVILIPFAMGFAALAFWFDEGELHFSVFEREGLKSDDSRDVVEDEDAASAEEDEEAKSGDEE